MTKLTIITIIALGMLSTNVSAADVPMQCSLTCTSAPATVDELLAQRTGAVTGVPLSAEADSDTANTGGFDFVTECLQYKGRIWSWREGKCKSMSPDWKSPGIGNYVKY